MGRQQIPERVQRLKPEDVRIRYLQAAALVVKGMDAAKHAFDSEKIHFWMGGGASGEETPLAASDLHLKRTGFGKGKRQRLAGI